MHSLHQFGARRSESSTRSRTQGAGKRWKRGSRRWSADLSAAKARRRPLEPVRIQAENRAPIRVAHPRPPQQQQALEAHVRADAPAVAVAPENARYWTYSVCTICLISVCVCFSVTQHFAFGIPSDCNSREKEVCSNIQRLFKLSAARLTPTAQTSDSQAFLHMQYHPRQIRHSVLELYRDICLKTFHASVNTDNQPTGIRRLIIAHSRPTSFRDLLCSTKMVQPENERAGKFWKRSSSRR
jgi:hypothetical protein